MAKRTMRMGLLAGAIASFGLVGGASTEEDATFGSWSLGAQAPGHLLATHAILLRNNKILIVGGSSYNCCYTWGIEESRLYDIAADSWSLPLGSPAPYGSHSPDPEGSNKDAFCGGHAHDAAGGVIFQGGLYSYKHNGTGIGDSARYDPAVGTWTPLGGALAHWYPTLVAGVGHTFLFPGLNTQLDHAVAGEHVQMLAYGATSWVTTDVLMPTKGTYPRVSLLPDGRLFIASPSDDEPFRKSYTFDPVAGTKAPAGTNVVPESEPDEIHGSDQSWKGTGVLLPLVPSQKAYPHARFALINGVKAYVMDLAQAGPAWKTMGTRPSELGSPSPTRAYANSTLLPTGQVLVTGGVAPPEMETNAVKKAELYDPEEDRWLLTAPASVPRNYHGVALLQPDGRVWTASGSQDHHGSQCGWFHNIPPDGVGDCNHSALEKTEERVEIFTPWYYSVSRPVITSCPAEIVPDGRPFKIGVAPSRGAAAVQRVVLMRAGSATHSFDTDQRLVQLDITAGTGSAVTVNSPYTAAAAPPGDYMLFALRPNAEFGFKRWVPSVGCWTRVGVARREGAPIWRYTGPPCSGESCPGWQRLDNNPKTVAIAAAGTHHHQSLYQLHNDGWIWRYAGTPCSGDSCPGWQRLDNNPKTYWIAAAADDLYQLHNDGWIWRYTGTPCTGDSCPGWQQLDNNTKTVGISAAGGELYQLHNDGWIWHYTGTPCTGDSCPGWQRLDNNSKTVAIAAGGSNLYQLHNDGWIWRYTGTPCSGDSCPGWQRLDNNSKTVAIAAGGSNLYQLHNDGWIWRYTGTPCSGDSCPGWQRLDNNSKTVALAATDNGLFQMHVDGRIWRYTGTPCSGDSCPGWQQVDNNPHTGMIAAGDPAMVGSGDHLYQLHVDPLYQLHSDGWIWRYMGTECDEQFCPGWELLDNNARTKSVVAAGNQLFQLHNDGRIWRYLGDPCKGESCPAWRLLDNNPNTRALAAGGNQLYQLHANGAIWRHTGVPCSGNSCPGWQQLDNNPRSLAIAASATSLFQLHNNGAIWRYTGKPCVGSSCTGWLQLDNNPRTKSIVAAGNQLFQLHTDGRIWRHTGTPCTGSSCPGWQLLDNNPKTVALAAGANQLYQLHDDGAVWRYTGVPCTGDSCPGWERLDNNPNTREIVATVGHLYQRHSDGRIWRYVGAPCSGNTCPGWRLLDNNPKTARIAVGGFN